MERKMENGERIYLRGIEFAFHHAHEVIPQIDASPLFASGFRFSVRRARQRVDVGVK